MVEANTNGKQKEKVGFPISQSEFVELKFVSSKGGL